MAKMSDMKISPSTRSSMPTHIDRDVRNCILPLVTSRAYHHGQGSADRCPSHRPSASANWQTNRHFCMGRLYLKLYLYHHRQCSTWRNTRRQVQTLRAASGPWPSRAGNECNHHTRCLSTTKPALATHDAATASATPPTVPSTSFLGEMSGASLLRRLNLYLRLVSNLPVTYAPVSQPHTIKR
ncbi:hypothetical protein H257_18339 [Aphanomyces astaci]|uniref:Uncharacterized protein n=1 Tax=Aphanomyces astaci TaxID=112090 RepID=W4FBG4_APHAT|nr:hypothetical protein H257_18339 [Aphanomyces astaci]ETV64822.1 hypothetical protein H257_18339 [Aphanomyces astaci]|eukprot:XP_009845679.1 hypothetical protein H257_18339 [Aphanomyces astaci]